MFSRYTLTLSADETAQQLGVGVPDAYSPSYNAAPSHLLPVVTNDSPKGLSFFYWGAPPAWANKKPLGEKIINTRAEAIAEKSVLKKKLREQRCIIPADGFYEWKRVAKRTTIPYRFTLKDKSLFAFAGLWEEYEDEQGEMHHTFSVITAAANQQHVAFNERMPVILTPDRAKQWLQNSAEDFLLSELRPFSDELDFYSVSQQINSSEKNSRLLILPAPPADQYGNLTLFD
ncbi:MAG: SOS response-associated peptidase [Cyclobacteriaceae bacterium]|nr:SOS response-associated peptidase [Cyclobacteriaceae bacterium]